MFLRSIIPRAPRARFTPRIQIPSSRIGSLMIPSPLSIRHRGFAMKATADEAVEEIQEQYATAKDEFEIAQEETEKMSVYAEGDREAAREELDKLHTMFQEATSDPKFGDEVRSRVGQRIRELDNAVKNMEEMAMQQD